MEIAMNELNLKTSSLSKQLKEHASSQKVTIIIVSHDCHWLFRPEAPQRYDSITNEVLIQERDVLRQFVGSLSTRYIIRTSGFVKRIVPYTPANAHI